MNKWMYWEPSSFIVGFSGLLSGDCSSLYIRWQTSHLCRLPAQRASIFSTSFALESWWPKFGSNDPSVPQSMQRYLTGFAPMFFWFSLCPVHGLLMVRSKGPAGHVPDSTGPPLGRRDAPPVDGRPTERLDS